MALRSASSASVTSRATRTRSRRSRTSARHRRISEAYARRAPTISPIACDLCPPLRVEIDMRLAFVLALAACGGPSTKPVAAVAPPPPGKPVVDLPPLAGSAGACGGFDKLRDTLDVVDGRIKVAAPK